MNEPRKRALELISRTPADEAMDLSPDELGDRVVPKLGLGADGKLRLDYGPRFFDVGFGFDELLRPRVTDEAGNWHPQEDLCDPFGTLEPVTASEIPATRPR